MSTEYPAENENELMRCPSCGADVSPQDVYCSTCGAPTGAGPRWCVFCGTEVLHQDMYCSTCGAPTSAEPHRCVSCGAEMPPTDASCTKCGARNEHRRRYSLWRVGILTFLSIGLYYFYWMGVSWKHLAEEMPGKEFHPFWHAMSQFVPIYNFVVIYQHFRTIKDVQERERVESNLVPGLALALSIVLPYILFIAWIILASVPALFLQISPGTPAVAALWGVILILMYIGAVAGTFMTLVLWGQRNLNKYWERPGARPVRSARTGPGEIIISGAGGLVPALVIALTVMWVVITLSSSSPLISSVYEADSFERIQVGSVGHRGTIVSHLQVDSYDLPVQEGAGYVIYVSPTTLGLRGDPLEGAIVALWDSDGTTILHVENADTPIVIPWTASSSGAMYVTIESDGTDLGNYVLRIAKR